MSQLPSMEEILLRFPHLGEQIFQSLDFENLSNCAQVSKFWHDFINNEKIITSHLLIEFIQKCCGNPDACTKAIFGGHTVYHGLPKGEMLIQIFVLKLCDLSALIEMAKAAMKFFKEDPLSNVEFIGCKGYGPKNYGVTPLHFAAISGQWDILTKMFDAGVDKNLRDYRGRTLLYFAVYFNHPDVCQLIISYEREKNPRDFNKGHTLLHWASKQGHFNLFRYIFEIIYDKNPQDYAGNTPLHCAAEKGHLSICKMILENVDNKNPKNKSDVTPLQLAVFKNHSNVVGLIQSALDNASVSETSSEMSSEMFREMSSDMSSEIPSETSSETDFWTCRICQKHVTTCPCPTTYYQL